MSVKAVLFTGEDGGCDEDCVEATQAIFEGSEDFELQSMSIRSVGKDGLPKDTKVILVPGGDVWGDADGDTDAQLGALGKQGAEVVARAVHEGAVYIGVCAGSFMALEIPFGLKGRIKTVHTDTFGFTKLGQVHGYIPLKPGEDADPELIGAFGEFLNKAWYDNGPLFEAKEDDDITVLAYYHGKFECEHEEDDTISEEDIKREGPKMQGKAACIACRVGNGMVIMLSPHPELSDGSEEMMTDLAKAALALLE